MASDVYSAAWDFARLGLGAVSAGVNGMTLGGGTLAGTAGFSTGLYMHGNVGMVASATIDGVALLPWVDDINDIVTGGTLGATFSRSTLRYTLSCASAFTVTWNGALGIAMRDIFGFEANLGSATSHTSTKRPKYLIKSLIPGQSQDSDTYEPGGRIDYAEADDGTQYSTRPSTIATYRDWTQPYESNTGPTDAEYAATSAVAGAPMRIADLGSATKVYWSWEEFFKHVRAELPFALIATTAASSEGAVYKLRGESAHFNPQRVTADFAGHWSPRLQCVYKGASAEV